MTSSSKYFKIEQVPKDTYEAFANPNFHLFSITPNEKPQTTLGKGLITEVPLMKKEYLRVIDDVYEFKVRSDDVFLITFPKSGTTWGQEMLWLIVNDFDFETAKKVKLEIRSPFLERDGALNKVPVPFRYLEDINNMKTQRVIKTHLMSTLLPKSYWEIQPKTVFIIRNFKDVAVSFYHFNCLMGSGVTNLNDFVDMFVKDTMLYAPYWEMILNFWNLRHEKNVLLINYEDMHKDLPAVIRKCCEFLNKPYNEEVVAELAEHLSFANMKDNPSVNYERQTKASQEKTGIKFMRKGAVGSYKEELSEDSIAKLNQWAKDKIAKYDSDFDLKID